VDKKESLHYMASRCLRFLHRIHIPYDDNEFRDEGSNGVLGDPGTFGTTANR
jgi:hypothetical protein